MDSEALLDLTHDLALGVNLTHLVIERIYEVIYHDYFYIHLEKLVIEQRCAHFRYVSILPKVHSGRAGFQDRLIN